MKTLHYNIYENGNVGMSNILMSIENALLIAKLTNRDHVIFYGEHPIFNSKSKKTIFDVYDIKYNYSLSYGDIPEHVTKFKYELHNACIYEGEVPTKDFLNGRTNLINLEQYKDVEHIGTLNSNTLSFYSYLFYFSNSNKRKLLQDFIKNSVVPKQKYINEANNLIEQLKSLYGEYNSIHVRRGDYLLTDSENKNIECNDLFIPFDNNKLLVVHSDESSDYFSCLKDKYSKIWYIDRALHGDEVEKGIVSMLVASHSSDFIGTMYSTFTSYIQRYRMYNGYREDFKFLYSQDKDVSLVNGRFKESSFGENTWNRISLSSKLKSICFWFREWQESYYQPSLKQQIRTVPDFVSEEEIQFIISQLNDNEFFERENRNRTVLDTQSGILNGLVRRACKELGYDYDCVEHGLQVFKQYKDGQTFLHTDSVFEDEQGKRIASVLFYLNEDFKGSYIDFPYVGIRISPNAGTMITYPLINEWNEQDVKWSHSASVITKGYKIMSYFSIKQYSKNGN